jgi:hypothetical protein
VSLIEAIGAREILDSEEIRQSKLKSFWTMTPLAGLVFHQELLRVLSKLTNHEMAISRDTWARAFSRLCLK